jgi:hypothetical protein
MEKELDDWVLRRKTYFSLDHGGCISVEKLRKKEAIPERL